MGREGEIVVNETLNELSLKANKSLWVMRVLEIKRRDRMRVGFAFQTSLPLYIHAFTGGYFIYFIYSF